MSGLGSVFIYYGKIMTALFDRRKDVLLITSTSILCAIKLKAYRLSEIKSVRAVERGYEKN